MPRSLSRPLFGLSDCVDSCAFALFALRFGPGASFISNPPCLLFINPRERFGAFPPLYAKGEMGKSRE